MPKASISVGVRPRQQGPIAACIRDERLTRRSPPRRGHACGYLPRQSPPAPCVVMLLVTGWPPQLARVGGQDCDEPWVQQAPITAHPVSWLPYELPAGDDRQISSEDRRSVKLRPPPTGTHQCHRATPTGRRIGQVDRLFDDLWSPMTQERYTAFDSSSQLGIL